MRLNSYIIYLAVMLSIAACKSVRNSSSSIKKPTNNSVKKKTPQKREFINGIEVTLGATTKTNHQSSSSATGFTKKIDEPFIGKSEKEKAHFLQLKYAV